MRLKKCYERFFAPFAVLVSISAPVVLTTSCIVTDFIKIDMAIMNSNIYTNESGLWVSKIHARVANEKWACPYIYDSSILLLNANEREDTDVEMKEGVALFVERMSVRVELNNYRKFIRTPSKWIANTNDEYMETTNTLDTLLGQGFLNSVSIDFGGLVNPKNLNILEDDKVFDVDNLVFNNTGSGFVDLRINKKALSNTSGMPQYIYGNSNAHIYRSGDYDTDYCDNKSHVFGLLSTLRLRYTPDDRINSLKIAVYPGPNNMNFRTTLDGATLNTGAIGQNTWCYVNFLKKTEITQQTRYT